MPRLQSIHPVLMVRDLALAIDFYERLGFRVSFQDAPEHPLYAGLRRDDVELHVQWHDASEWDHPTDRPTYRFQVEDVDGLHAEFSDDLQLADCTPVTDTAWGTREFHLRDPDGNGLQFYRDR